MRCDLLARVAAGALLLGACYEQHEPQVGGESHFMEVCTSDCDGDLACIGNVCTRECAHDDECASLGSAVTCVGADAAKSPHVCGVECEASETCDLLGDGFTCAESSCRPVEVAVAVAEAPLVLFVIDTSGSMERLPVCTCSTAACTECMPGGMTSSGMAASPAVDGCTLANDDAGASPKDVHGHEMKKNRWAVTLEALTGTFRTNDATHPAYEGFACERLARTQENGMSYDLGYFIPYQQPWDCTGATSRACPYRNPTATCVTDGDCKGLAQRYCVSGRCEALLQNSDGILDEYSARVRFGMATFDGWDTYAGFPPLIPGAEFDTATSHDWAGLWSYGVEKDFRYPNAAADYRMDTGIRGPNASEGALTVAVDSATYRATNGEIQTSLLAVRPYGGTPIAGALDDVDYYFATDPEAQKVPVHLRHVVLITDGYPDSDYRDYGCDCTQNADAKLSTYCGGPADCNDPTTCPNHPDNMHCPYDTPENIADRLVTGGGSKAAQVERLFVVGLAIDDPEVRAKLDTIAIAGGEPQVRVARSATDLHNALAAILDDILANP